MRNDVPGVPPLAQDGDDVLERPAGLPAKSSLWKNGIGIPADHAAMWTVLPLHDPLA